MKSVWVLWSEGLLEMQILIIIKVVWVFFSNKSFHIQIFIALILLAFVGYRSNQYKLFI